MKIYTKTGDSGKTGLLGGTRVSKACLQIEMIGALDELNCGIGKLRAATSQHPELSVADPGLRQIQNSLFQIGATLADNRKESVDRNPTQPTGQEQIMATWTKQLEQQIDQWESELPALTQFILPAGALASSEAHYVRAICRRTERRLVEFSEQETVRDRAGTDAPLAQKLIYLNRLSDYLFVMARWINKQLGISDQPWEGMQRPNH